MDDEGNEVEDNTPESDLEDIPMEDKCLTLCTKTDTRNVWVINRMADKMVRQDLAAEFRQFVEKLEHIDPQDFNFRLEEEAMEFESKFTKLFEDVAENTSNAPKVPVFEYRPEV